MKLTDCIGETKGDSKGNYGAYDCVDQNVDDVLAKVLLLEVVASCEDHWGKKSVEEDIFAKLQLCYFYSVVHDESEDHSDEDTCSCFVDEVQLPSQRGT